MLDSAAVMISLNGAGGGPYVIRVPVTKCISDKKAHRLLTTTTTTTTIFVLYRAVQAYSHLVTIIPMPPCACTYKHKHSTSTFPCQIKYHSFPHLSQRAESPLPKHSLHGEDINSTAYLVHTSGDSNVRG